MKRCLILIMLLLATQFLQAQKDTIKNIVFEGAGIRGIPIRIFDSTKYINVDALNSFAYNPQTLGLRIDSDAQVEQNNSGKVDAPCIQLIKKS